MGKITDISKDNNVFTETKEKLDSIGPGMCLAKMDTSNFTITNRT